MATKNMRVNHEYFNNFRCSHCKYWNGERTINGVECTCPDKEWRTSTAKYRRHYEQACTFFMQHRDDPLVVYIAGPMTGLPRFNRTAFKNTEKMLRNLGFRPINPAVLPTDLPDEAYMPICFAMLEQCDAIYTMSGWEKSRGALMEVQHALELGIKKLEADDLVIHRKEEGEDSGDDATDNVEEG